MFCSFLSGRLLAFPLYQCVFHWAPKSLQMVTATLKLKDTCSLEEKLWQTSWKKNYDQPRQHIKKQRHYFANKGPSSQSYGFSSSHVWMWELDHKESWALKNWCFWTVVLEKTLESPLDSKEIKPVHPKGNQSWIFTGKTDDKAEAPILWPPDVNNWLTGEDPDAGKDWRQEEKGTTEDEVVGWHHQHDGHEFEQVLGVGDGQRSLTCCSSRGHKECDTTEWLNWMYISSFIYYTHRTMLVYMYIFIIFQKNYINIQRNIKLFYILIEQVFFNLEIKIYDIEIQ